MRKEVNEIVRRIVLLITVVAVVTAMMVIGGAGNVAWAKAGFTTGAGYASPNASSGITTATSHQPSPPVP